MADSTSGSVSSQNFESGHRVYKSSPARGVSPRSADANDIFISGGKACGWVFFGGRQEADPRSECFTASPSHQRASQWARGEDKLPEE